MTKVNDNYPKNEMSDAQLKALAVQNYQTQQIKQSNFPTEVISLPSEGKVYNPSSPLSSGEIEMKYMTAREEDILTSGNLIRQGIVLDKLFQSLIVTPINYNELVIGDKNAIMIAARILGYGKDYDIEINCPACNVKKAVTVDLNSLPEKSIPETSKIVGINEFEFTLPNSKRIVTFKLLSHGDEKAIQAELDSRKKGAKKDDIDKELSTRLRYIIQSVDGIDDKKYIENFVENELLAFDSKSLRRHVKDTSPDQKFEIEFTCDSCGHVEEALEFAIDSNFFWPK